MRTRLTPNCQPDVADRAGGRSLTRDSRTMAPRGYGSAMSAAVTHSSRFALRRLLLFFSAVLALLHAWIAVRFLPFAQAIRSGSVPLPEQPAPRHDRTARELGWAVRAAARRLPLRTVCIHKGLALQRLLRRRGIDAVLHYGAAFDSGSALHAHVWVAADGLVLIGEEEAAGFRSLATFP